MDFYEVLDIFPRLSYQLTFISDVECGHGRQPRILSIGRQFLNSEIQNTCSAPGFHALLPNSIYLLKVVMSDIFV